MSNENMVHVGIYFPKDTLKRIDERRGRYYSRNKYFLKIAEEHLNDIELKNLQGPEFRSPAQAAPTTTTPTNLHTGTPAVENGLRDMSNQQRPVLGGSEAVVANRKKVNSFV
jgi:hypothetical protein